MTTHRLCHCGHCHVCYTFQASGPGCNEVLNNKSYCPDCMEVILSALKNIPIQVERFRERVTGDERDSAILAFHDLKVERAKKAAAGDLVIRRIFAPLFDMNDGKIIATQRFERVMVKGIYYIIGTWSDNREPPQVEREMERNLQTGEVWPWVEIT